MSKFKVGDLVTRVNGEYEGMQVGDTATITSVEDKHYAGETQHYRLDKYLVCHSERNLKLVEDEQLPPVPDSVLYFNSEKYGEYSNDQRLTVGAGSKYTKSGNLFIGVEPSAESDIRSLRGHGFGINLSPEDAIQLAYDIKRMARKMIKERDA